MTYIENAGSLEGPIFPPVLIDPVSKEGFLKAINKLQNDLHNKEKRISKLESLLDRKDEIILRLHEKLSKD